MGVRARGEVPKAWRRDSQRRRCLDLPTDNTSTPSKGSSLGFGESRMFLLRRWDCCGCLPRELTREALKRTLRPPNAWLILRVLFLAIAALLMILLGAREGGASALPGQLVQERRKISRCS